MSQAEPRAGEAAEAAEAAETEPVVFYERDPPRPLLGPVGLLLTIATFFYFFL